MGLSAKLIAIVFASAAAGAAVTAVAINVRVDTQCVQAIQEEDAAFDRWRSDRVQPGIIEDY